jgi:arylformamidase
MPHILCRPIKPDQEGLWAEGPAYEVKEIYRFGKGGPPVHYDAHILKPHSFCHVESALHVDPKGRALNTNSDVSSFWGETVVIKIRNPTWEPVEDVPNQKRNSRYLLHGCGADSPGWGVRSARLSDSF